MAREPADTQHEHGGVISRDKDDESGSTFQEGPSLLHSGEDTHGSHNIFGTRITPFDIGRVSLLEDGDGLLIDDKVCFLRLDCAEDLLCVESY